MLCGCAVKQISFRCSSCQPVWLLLIVRLCACHIQTATLFSRSTISFISIKKIDNLFLKCRFFPTYRFKSQKKSVQQLINLFFFTRVRMDQMDRIQRFQQSLKKRKKQTKSDTVVLYVGRYNTLCRFQYCSMNDRRRDDLVRLYNFTISSAFGKFQQPDRQRGRGKC